MSSIYNCTIRIAGQFNRLESWLAYNLANMNTQGFKSDNVPFEDAMNAVNDSLQVGSSALPAPSPAAISHRGRFKPRTGPPRCLSDSGESAFFVVQNVAGE